MPRTIRFHLDEHVSQAVARGLRRLGIDVTTPGSANLLGADDTEHLAFALSDGHMVFSEDDDFLVLAAAGIEHAGIAYCKQNTRSIGHIIRALTLIWEVYEPHEMKDRIEFI